MKKAAFIVLSFLISMFFSTQVTYAEENICKYAFKYDNGIVNEVRIVTVSYDEDGFTDVSLTDEEGNSLIKGDGSIYTTDVTIEIDKSLTFDKWMEAVNNSKSANRCPYKIIVGLDDRLGGSLATADYHFYVQDQVFGGFLTEFVGACINCDLDDTDSIFGDDFDSCDVLIGPNVMKYINTGMGYIKIIIPILVIVLGTFDFVRAVFATSEDDMKKAQKTFIRRLIIAGAIFISPYFVNLLINITNNVAGFLNNGTCGIS